MANPHWARWIHASVAKFLHDEAEDYNTENSTDLKILVEGIDDRDDPFMEAPDRVEIRVNGPFSSEVSKGYHKINVDVNCLFFSQMGGEGRNAYLLEQFLGLFHQLMDGQIPIFKLGNGPDDDSDELLGCLSPRPGKNDAIRVIHFGQIDATNRVREGMVDARYVMYLLD